MSQRDASPLTSVDFRPFDGDYLDAHYRVKQPEYEATLRSVGFEQDWHVLDAGCGAGSFLPLIAEIVGGAGRISALDLEPSNVATVALRAERGEIPCRLAASVGSILDLPYGDNRFDAVWSANTLQYLSDDELAVVLTEYRRVVRPGGLVAIKEVDLSGTQFHPLEPTVLWRLIECHRRAENRSSVGALRGPRLPTWLRQAGLSIVSRQTTLAERWAPLSSLEKTFVGHLLKAWADGAKGQDLPAADLRVWREIGESPDKLLSQPDFCYRGMYVLTVGQVPAR